MSCRLGPLRDTGGDEFIGGGDDRIKGDEGNLSTKSSSLVSSSSDKKTSEAGIVALNFRSQIDMVFDFTLLFMMEGMAHYSRYAWKRTKRAT